ncbi:MAG TPA: hypothetical protein VFY14_04235 [Streptomyces sp.]|nr:hypothetical protein [Streptomyces sp.]
MMTAGRTVRTAAAVLAVIALGGCGIRSTPVPVDAGPAPSRASCAAPDTNETHRPGDGIIRTEVFLVCSGGVAAVQRAVPLNGGKPGRATRLGMARELLDELRRKPSPAESEAGFGSSVPNTLRVSGPEEGDPEEALRLSEAPAELPPFALAQIVCTFAGTAAIGQGGSVVLGGPAQGGDGRGGGGEPPLSYACTGELRHSPDAAKTAGTPFAP